MFGQEGREKSRWGNKWHACISTPPIAEVVPKARAAVQKMQSHPVASDYQLTVICPANGACATPV